jgi:hypothetical protein
LLYDALLTEQNAQIAQNHTTAQSSKIASNTVAASGTVIALQDCLSSFSSNQNVNKERRAQIVRQFWLN